MKVDQFKITSDRAVQIATQFPARSCIHIKTPAKRLDPAGAVIPSVRRIPYPEPVRCAQLRMTSSWRQPINRTQYLTMDFNYSAEDEAFRAEVRAWLEANQQSAPPT